MQMEAWNLCLYGFGLDHHLSTWRVSGGGTSFPRAPELHVGSVLIMAMVLAGQGCCSPRPFKHHPSGPLANSEVLIRPFHVCLWASAQVPFPFPPGPVASLSWLKA